MPIAHRLQIRPAAREDLDTLVRFSHAMAQETEGRDLEWERLRQGTFAVLESSAKGFYLVAELCGETPAVVGQLLITYEWSDWRNATFWWIQSVYVDPSRRRQGVYRRLYEDVVNRARAQPDVCGIRLYVERDNQVAQSVYRMLNLRQTHYQIWEVDFVL
ncbi:MAG TPA: GNAT family N-acetyltransferase [Nitrospiraceae bacterium]|nr:GNAT family N-acetyltransferase [Nitrospiraceae bacterium]